MEMTRYGALAESVGVALLPPRTEIELAGRDRATFLHGLCTNDIRRLAAGQSCEAFLTNVQGKTLGYVYVHGLPDRLVLETVGGQAATILEQLDRYQIREDVQFRDCSADRAELLIAGKDAPRWLEQQLGQPLPPPLGNAACTWNGRTVWLRRVPFAGQHSFLLGCAAEQQEAVLAHCRSNGALDGGPDWVEIVRIEAGTPLFGCDVTADNLPQEVNRNEQAISFTKGCYLGQETIARLDARGHVNRLLVGLRFEGADTPSPGTVVASGGKSLARVTSACWSPALEAPLALAYVRRGYEAPGTLVPGDALEATVVQLPIAGLDP